MPLLGRCRGRMNVYCSAGTRESYFTLTLDGTLVDSATDLYRAMNMSLNALQLPLVTLAASTDLGW